MKYCETYNFKIPYLFLLQGSFQERIHEFCFVKQCVDAVFKNINMS